MCQFYIKLKIFIYNLNVDVINFDIILVHILQIKMKRALFT